MLELEMWHGPISSGLPSSSERGAVAWPLLLRRGGSGPGGQVANGGGS